MTQLPLWIIAHITVKANGFTTIEVATLGIGAVSGVFALFHYVDENKKRSSLIDRAGKRIAEIEASEKEAKTKPTSGDDSDNPIEQIRKLSRLADAVEKVELPNDPSKYHTPDFDDPKTKSEFEEAVFQAADGKKDNLEKFIAKHRK